MMQKTFQRPTFSTLSLEKQRAFPGYNSKKCTPKQNPDLHVPYSVKNIFVGTKRITEYKMRKMLFVAQATQCQMLGSPMKWKMSERK